LATLGPDPVYDATRLRGAANGKGEARIEFPPAPTRVVRSRHSLRALDQRRTVRGGEEACRIDGLSPPRHRVDIG